MLIKPLVFRLQYRLSMEEKVIDSGVSTVGLAKLAAFSAILIGIAGTRVADLLLEADGGKFGWLCVVVFSDLLELGSICLNCVSSPLFSP